MAKGIQLFDKCIADIMALLEPFEGKQLDIDAKPIWPDVGNSNMILKSDMAYELGGGNLPAVSGAGFVTDETLQKDELILYGPDLQEMTEDSPYARIVIAKLDENKIDRDNKNNALYDLLRDIEYERYRVSPEGYMMRISVSGNREPVRISKAALEKGISFADAGSSLIEAYRKHVEVDFVKMIYITETKFPYDLLVQKVDQMAKITDALDYIFKNIKMDCSTCALKPVCDEVDELREMHFQA